MQNTAAIVRQPILYGILASVAVHAVLLQGRSIYSPPVPQIDSGRTVVQLTLVPSLPVPPSISESRAVDSADSRESIPAPAPAPQPQQEISAAGATAVSGEPDAADDPDKGVIREAMAVTSVHPTYPRVSRRRGEEGVVVLAIQVRSDGSAGEIEILRSSGYRRLDEAAVHAAERTVFNPALRFGRPVDSRTELSFTFRLTDD